MASHKELSVEWTMLDGDYNNWTLQGKQLNFKTVIKFGPFKTTTTGAQGSTH